MFNLGVGEIVVLGLLAIIFFGPAKLSDLAASFRAGTSTPVGSRWTGSDWILLCVAVLTGAIALALVSGPRP